MTTKEGTNNNGSGNLLLTSNDNLITMKTAPPIPPKPPRVLALKRYSRDKLKQQQTGENNYCTKNNGNNNSTLTEAGLQIIENQRHDHDKSGTPVVASPQNFTTTISNSSSSNDLKDDKNHTNPISSNNLESLKSPLVGEGDPTTMGKMLEDKKIVSESDKKTVNPGGPPEYRSQPSISASEDLKSSSSTSSSYEEIFFDAQNQVYTPPVISLVHSSSSSTLRRMLLAANENSGDTNHVQLKGVLKSSTFSQVSSADSSCSNKNGSDTIRTVDTTTNAGTCVPNCACDIHDVFGIKDHCPLHKIQAREENVLTSSDCEFTGCTKNQVSLVVETTAKSSGCNTSCTPHSNNGVIIKVPPSVIDTSNYCSHSDCRNCMVAIDQIDTSGNRVVDDGSHSSYFNPTNEHNEDRSSSANEFKSVIQVKWPNKNQQQFAAATVMEADSGAYEKCAYYSHGKNEKIQQDPNSTTVNGLQMRVVCNNGDNVVGDEDGKPLVIHAVINLPPKQANNLMQKRRRKTTANPNLSSSSFYEKSSKMSEAMAAEYNQNVDRLADKKKSATHTMVTRLATFAPAKLVRSRSGSVSNTNFDDEDGERESVKNERRASTSSLVLGSFSNLIPEKTKHSFSRSSSLVQRRVRTVGRKVGSWYVKRLKTPVVDQLDGEGRGLKNRLSFLPFASGSDSEDKDSGCGVRSRRNSSIAGSDLTSEFDSNLYATVSVTDEPEGELPVRLLSWEYTNAWKTINVRNMKCPRLACL